MQSPARPDGTSSRVARRVAVTGATGNVGSSLVPALLAAGYEVTAIERHRPTAGPWAHLDGVRWCIADIGRDPLDPGWFEGAVATVHLAWAIQPSHRPERLFRTNIAGSRRVFEASIAAGVPHIVHASSLAAYSATERDAVVDERFPTDATPVLDYAWQKAYVERLLDAIELEHPDVVVTRVRPALVLRGASAERVHSMFSARVPRRLLAAMLPLATRSPIAAQVVHTDDVADAVVRIIERRAGGAFNLAADPVLGSDRRLGRPLADTAAALLTPAWRARLLAADPGWLRTAARAPVLDCSRARDVLDWHPRFDAEETLARFAAGLRGDADDTMAPAAPVPSTG